MLDMYMHTSSRFMLISAVYSLIFMSAVLEIRTVMHVGS
jgi:hypothetical protein